MKQQQLFHPLIQLNPETLFPKWTQIFDFVQELNKQDLEHSLWTSLISQKLKESNLDIGNHALCVVGEANGFKPNGCETCGFFACGDSSFVSLFHNLKHGLIENNNDDWRESDTVKRFITHFKQIHS